MYPLLRAQARQQLTMMHWCLCSNFVACLESSVLPGKRSATDAILKHQQGNAPARSHRRFLTSHYSPPRSPEEAGSKRFFARILGHRESSFVRQIQSLEDCKFSAKTHCLWLEPPPLSSEYFPTGENFSRNGPNWTRPSSTGCFCDKTKYT